MNDKGRWDYISKSRVTMPREDFDASAMTADCVEVTRTEKEITVRVGDLVTLSRDTKAEYTHVSVTAWDWDNKDRVDLSLSFGKREPKEQSDPYGNPPLARVNARIN